MSVEPAVPKLKGLLSKASEISKNSISVIPDGQEECIEKNAFLAFHQFALDFDLKKTGVFKTRGDFFALTVSHGLDRETLQKPETPSDFWQTVYFSQHEKNRWVTFIEEKMRPFLPLFSQIEQKEIKAVSLRTFEFENEQLILCVFDTQDSFFPENSTKLTATFNTILPVIARSGLSGLPHSYPQLAHTKISNALEKGYCANIFTLDFSILFLTLPVQMTIQDRMVLANSLFNRLSVAVGSHNICVSPMEGIFQLFVFTQIPLGSAMYPSLLNPVLRTFFDEEQLLQLKITTGITAYTEAEISTFFNRKV